MVALAKSDGRILDTIIQGNCLEVLHSLVDNSMDAIVTDPPAGIEFMGREWDSFKDDKRSKGWAVAYDGEKNDKVENNGFYTKMRPSFYNQGKKERDNFISFMTEVMTECLRVLKPGGHALIWALPRTSHWTATAIEDAGFEIRDVLTHLFGSGFPKSMDISKAMDRMQGAEREVIGNTIYGDGKTRPAIWSAPNSHEGWKRPSHEHYTGDRIVTVPSTPQAQQWQGYGTALKPASEHWILARKPLSEKSIAENVLRWGTGGLNIDQCRVQASERPLRVRDVKDEVIQNAYGDGLNGSRAIGTTTQGRFPANLLLSHSLFCTDETCTQDCPIAEVDRQSGVTSATGRRSERSRNAVVEGTKWGVSNHQSREYPGDIGGASRYFTQFSPTIPDVLYCSLCRLPYVVKHGMMNEKEGDIIPCLKSVKSAEKSSKHTHEHQDIVLGHAQEQRSQEQEGKNQRRSIPANNVVSNGWNTQAITDYSAQQSAWGLPIEEIAQLVRSAVNLCDSCVTAIAQSLVGLKHKTSPALPHGLASMPEINAHILHRNLVAYVDSLEKSGITPTTANLMRLFGSVEHAISQYTTPVSRLSINESDQITPYRYQSKASRTERNRGCEGLPKQFTATMNDGIGKHEHNPDEPNAWNGNHHPTVKPVRLMSWLCRLITPPDGTVLDCFVGSGSTCVAALQEGFHFIGIEQEAEYVEIARARIAYAMKGVN